MKKGSRSAAAHKKWIRDSDKELYWRKQVGLWKKSGLSVRAFCHQHQVVEGSFYAWRRELAIRDRESAASLHADSDMELPDTVMDSRGRMIPMRFRSQDDVASQQVSMADHPAADFVQLQLAAQYVPVAAAECKPDLEIICPNGFVIRTGANIERALLTRLVTCFGVKQC